MDTYELIKDEKALQEFIEFLPETTLHEKYLVCLFSRRKYANDKSTCPGESLIKRILVDKKDLIKSIRQLEIKKGFYTTNDGRVIPEESLCIYINPNPRCLRKGQIATIKELVNRIDDGQFCNPKSVAMSCIHKSKSRSVFVDFDIDVVSPQLKELFRIFPDNLNKNYFKVLKTRGGYHILVFLQNIDDKINRGWYKDILETFTVDQAGDELLPIPGCTQGGFVPRFMVEFKGEL